MGGEERESSGVGPELTQQLEKKIKNYSWNLGF